MDNVDMVLSRFPQYTYDPDNKKSALYKLIKSIVDEFNITISNIDRIDKMIGVDTVLPDDMYNRFGALLNIKRNNNESDDQYRNRLKTSITALSGGTAEAIKYAVACGLGINNDPIAMERIHIYDAWKYDGSSSTVTKDYGYVVCEIDLDNAIYSSETEEIVIRSANDVKASGVIVQFVYHNYRLMYYAEFDNLVYGALDRLTYNRVGE